MAVCSVENDTKNIGFNSAPVNPIVLSGSTGAVLKSQVPTAPAITYYGGGGG